MRQDTRSHTISHDGSSFPVSASGILKRTRKNAWTAVSLSMGCACHEFDKRIVDGEQHSRNFSATKLKQRRQIYQGYSQDQIGQPLSDELAKQCLANLKVSQHSPQDAYFRERQSGLFGTSSKESYTTSSCQRRVSETVFRKISEGDVVRTAFPALNRKLRQQFCQGYSQNQIRQTLSDELAKQCFANLKVSSQSAQDANFMER